MSSGNWMVDGADEMEAMERMAARREESFDKADDLRDRSDVDEVL